MAILDWVRRLISPSRTTAPVEWVEKVSRFQRAWDAYYGKFPQPLKTRRGQPDDTVIANFARVIVDKGVSFLFGQEVGFELDELQETEAEEWLDRVWRANRKMTLLQKAALTGAICGHVFVKIVPHQPYPRLILLDPSTVSVRWEPDDFEEISEYSIEYPVEDLPRVVRQLVLKDGVGWRIVDQVRPRDSEVWQTLRESFWGFPWSPIVDCQNLPLPNQFWGLGDLEDDILKLNQAINFLLSNLNRIVRYHAHPKTWGKGFSASQIDISADDLIILTSPDAELHNLEMTSDLSSSIALYERIREALHEVARIPEVATGKVSQLGALSGVALQILYQPLLEKTESKRRTYGDLLVELNRRLLALGGFGDELHTVLHWPELLPQDPKVEAEVSLMLQQIGVSQSTLLTRLGFDPDLEAQKQSLSSEMLGEKLLTAFDRGQ